MSKKVCFIISEIGKEGSDARQRADNVRDHIIKRALDPDYKCLRSDDIAEPGAITTQIIERLLNADLVVADLTNHNPNVFYELAIRHAFNKPVIMMIQSDQLLPFDVKPDRTIMFDSTDLASSHQAEDLLRQFATFFETHPGEVDSPVARAASFDAWKKTGDPNALAAEEQQKFMAEIRAAIEYQAKQVLNLRVALDMEKVPRNLGRLVARAGAFEVVHDGFDPYPQIRFRQDNVIPARDDIAQDQNNSTEPQEPHEQSAKE